MSEVLDHETGELLPVPYNDDAGLIRAALHAALARAQSAFPAIPRDRTVRVQTKTGGSYTFRYAPLDTVLAAVRPALAAEGLAISQLLDAKGTQPMLRTVLLHADGGMLESVWPISNAGTPQEFGSTLTYLRRYALVALLGVASEEDDDGNHASGTTAKPVPTDEALASKAQKDHIHRLISKIEQEGVATEARIREGMQVEYGTQLTVKLTKAQAIDFITRLKKIAGEEES